jgi:hypothetical protein
VVTSYGSSSALPEQSDLLAESHKNSSKLIVEAVVNRYYSFAILRQNRPAILTFIVLSCIFLASCGSSTSTNSTAGIVATITVSPSSPSVAVNANQQFTATAKDSAGNTVTGVTFTWTSSATNVATINSSGIATGVAAGTTQITASANGVTAAMDPLLVTSSSGVVATITVSPSSPSILVNANQQFTATAKDSGGNTITGVTFTWTSSLMSVATITNGGLATGVTAGTTQITAAASGVTAAADPLQVTSPVTQTAVTGTASMGLPIANALVTLKDSAGKSVTGTTAGGGTYSLTTTGMIPPFLIQVQAPSGNVYSVSADILATTTINTHVLSDLIIRSWYSAQGQDIDTAFSNPVSLPAPGVSNVQIIANAVVQSVQLWLNNAGVNTAVFNMISTPFVADGTGFDSVLHDTTVNTSTGNVIVTNGTTTQTSTITYSTSTDALTITSTTTTGATTSTNSITTLIPALPPQQTAINAINATLAGFTNAVNAKGSQVAAADVTPFMASNLLNDGENQTQYAAVLASDLVNFLNLGNPNTLSLGQVQLIKSMDLANGFADVIFSGALMQNGVSVAPLPTQVAEFWFERSGSAWLIGGDNQIARMQAVVGSGTSEGAQTGSSTTVEALIEVPEVPIGNLGTLTAITVSGGSIFNNSSSFQQGNQYSYSGGSLIIDELFDQSSPLSSSTIIPGGAQFLFSITPATGPVVNHTVPSNAFTNEAIAITTPANTASTAVANYAGHTVTVDWTLPTTFAIASINFGAKFQDLTQGDPSALTCDIGQILPNNATSGTITIPSTLTCATGQAVTRGDLDVQVNGVNGESTTAKFYFK